MAIETGGAEAEDARGLRGMEVSMPPVPRVGVSVGRSVWTLRAGWDDPGTVTLLSRGGTLPMKVWVRKAYQDR